MNTIEKFYTDAHKALGENADTVALAQYFRRAATRTCPEADTLIDDFASIIAESDEADPAQQALCFFALLDNNFDDTMDFSDADWARIRDSVSAAANDIDFSLVSDIMNVLVRRKKL